MYGSDYGSWMHGSGMFGGGLVMILMWLIPILFVVALIIFLTKRPGFGPNKKISLGILNRRLPEDADRLEARTGKVTLPISVERLNLRPLGGSPKRSKKGE